MNDFAAMIFSSYCTLILCEKIFYMLNLGRDYLISQKNLMHAKKRNLRKFLHISWK